MGENTPIKWQITESRCCHSYIRQSRLQDKKTMRDKEGEYIMIKGTFHQEDITLIKIYAPNTPAQKNIKQPLIDPK